MARITLSDWTCDINNCIDPLDGPGLTRDFTRYAGKIPRPWASHPHPSRSNGPTSPKSSQAPWRYPTPSMSSITTIPTNASPMATHSAPSDLRGLPYSKTSVPGPSSPTDNGLSRRNPAPHPFRGRTLPNPTGKNAKNKLSARSGRWLPSANFSHPPPRAPPTQQLGAPTAP
ncbi:hypothetical protein B0H13DRAFT_2102367 [Mycena leptocephala]|nr:hypothetical protein B0H13DRAFT_2102367 [Mycena leptocephala]